MIPKTDMVTSYITNTTDIPNTRGVMWGYDDGESSALEKEFDVSSLGKNDFLKLLLAQLQHQDPLNPTDNTEFVSQLAQFSSLEQVMMMNSNMEKSIENSSMMSEAISNAMLINYFGKQITAESNAFSYDGENAVELQFINDNGAYGKLEIINEEGKIVRTIPLDDMSSELNTVEWDGHTSGGVEAKAGTYTFNITAYDILDNEVDSTPLLTGIADGIHYHEGNAHVSIRGVLVPFNNVKSITQEE
ncbi:flagellar hook assembly protein FlgD [Candidatus Latescibacterota bacterium]